MTVKELVAVLGFKTDEASLRRAESAMTNAGKKMQRIGRNLTMMVTLPMLGFAAAAIKATTDFNAAMANIGTLIPGNAARIQQLKKEIQDLAIQTGKSTKDLADGAYQIISTFGDSAETMELLRISAEGSVAGLSSTADAINLTGAVTKAYGDTSAAAIQKVMDLSFKTAELGVTTFPELAGAIGSVAPLAATLGISVEELFNGFATLTGTTGNTNEVSTQLAAILRSMIKPTDSMGKAIKKLGYANSKAMLSTLGMKGSLQALIGTTDGSAESIATLFDRAEALTSIFSLTGEQSKIFDEKMVKLHESAGATQKAFREQTEGINRTGHAMEVMKRKAEVLAQKLGDGLAPALSDLLDRLDPVISKLISAAEWFDKADKPTQNLTLTILGLVAALGPLSKILGLISVNPITAGFLALAGAIAAVWNYSEKYRLYIKTQINDFLSMINSINTLVNDLLKFAGIDFRFGTYKLISTAGEEAKMMPDYGAFRANMPADMPLMATAGAGGGSTRVTRNIEINASVGMTFPPTFSPAQQHEIIDKARQVFGEELDRTTRQLQSNNREVE